MKRVAVFWKCNVKTMYVLLLQTGIIGKGSLSVNGEMFLDVTDEQYEHLCQLRDQGHLEFRNKPLKEENGKIVPTNV